MPSVRTRTNPERSAATRARLVKEARKAFGTIGYADTKTERILEAAGMTRGALYHHYIGKSDLFRAVCEDMYAEIAREIEARTRDIVDPWQSLVEGSMVFLDVLTNREVVQVLFLDGPAVLGWKEWDAIDRKYGFNLLLLAVEEAMVAGQLRKQRVEPLAVLLNGAMNEAVFWAARQRDRNAAVRQVKEAVRGLFEALHVSDKPRPRGR